MTFRIASTLTIFTLTLTGPLSGPLAAQNKKLPGLTERESAHLICATKCVRANEFCLREVGIVEITIGRLEDGDFIRLGSQPTRGALRCTQEMEQCLARCP